LSWKEKKRPAFTFLAAASTRKRGNQSGKQGGGEGSDQKKKPQSKGKGEKKKKAQPNGTYTSLGVSMNNKPNGGGYLPPDLFGPEKEVSSAFKEKSATIRHTVSKAQNTEKKNRERG